jgi:hypothetical protein
MKAQPCGYGLQWRRQRFELEGQDVTSLLPDGLSDPGTDGLSVLDNCEHVLDAASTLVDLLLCECPTLQILATSRELMYSGGDQLGTASIDSAGSGCGHVVY